MISRMMIRMKKVPPTSATTITTIVIITLLSVSLLYNYTQWNQGNMSIQ